MVAIGERIKESRKEKQLTQQQLAERLNVSRSAVSNWEVGRNYPDLDLVVQLSDLLEISLDHLLREDTIMVREVSKEQRKGVKRKWALNLILPLFIISLFTTGYFLYQDVGAIKDIFSPTITQTINLEDSELEWTPLTFEDGSYLNLQGPFWNEGVVNHASSESKLEVRLTDAATGDVIYAFALNPGKEYSLEKLSRNTDYLVEIKGNPGFYFLTFL